MARDLALERTWQERMRQFERSGLTIRKFCEREGLVDHQFSWWRAELKRRATKSPSAKKPTPPKGKKPLSSRKTPQQGNVPEAGFVPVRIESSGASLTSIEIILDRPPRIRVSSGFDAGLLREVVRVLGQA